MLCFALEKKVGKGDAVFDEKVAIEKMKMLRKTHRNVLDMDPGFTGRQ